METRAVEVTSESYGRALADLKNTEVAETLEGFGKQAALIFGHIGAGAVMRQAAVTVHQMSKEYPMADRLEILDTLLKPARKILYKAKEFNPRLAWKSCDLMSSAGERMRNKLVARAAQQGPTLG